MIFFRPIGWFLILFLYKISRGIASNVIDAQEKQLERNLKVLRNDFNRVIESVEDFTGDVLMQVHDAGKMIENTYVMSNDYNWQDDDVNNKEKTTKHILFSLPPITETPQTIPDKTLTFPKLHLPKIPNLITKNIEQQELSNDIEKREKRSTHKRPQEFENRPPAPISVQDRQQLENNGHRSAATILSQFPPFTDKTTNIRGDKAEQLRFVNEGERTTETILSEFPPFTDKTTNVKVENADKPILVNSNDGQRSAASAAPEFSPFTDRTIKNTGDQKEQYFLEAKESGHDKDQASGTTTFLPNQKSKDPLICTAKTQKEIDLESLKMEELKEEVKKLNELVALLKDQQRIIKMFNDVDKHLENNEVPDEKSNIEDSIKNSFLYRTLKQLQNSRKGEQVNNLMISDREPTLNKQAKPSIYNNSDSHIPNPGPTFEDLEKIKISLRTTAESLNKTKEVLIKEKQKEEDFEQELKRQNSELKFLKVMTENLYDKMGNKNADGKHGYKVYERDDKQRSSDFGDMELLESVHTPKTMPIHKYITTTPFPRLFTNPEIQKSNQGLKSLFLRQNLNSFTDIDRPLTRDEELLIKKQEAFDKLMEQWDNDPDISAYLKKDAMITLGKRTEEALAKLAKQDKDGYKKFFPNTSTRESNPEDNQGANRHEFLSVLNPQQNKNNNNENNRNHKAEETNRSDESFQENSQNNLNKENSTFLSTNARASSSGKIDDIDLKLRLLGILAKEAKEEKTDDSTSREKTLNDAVKKLLAPEKKSDDDQLDAIMTLFKEKRDEPKSEKSFNQENLKKLLKELNTKPQSKSDDDVESELKQLQKAINSLRPKEDSLLDNLDLNNFENNRKGKQDGSDIQSMLSQIIAQNGASATGLNGVDLAGADPNLDFSAAINANSGGSPGSLDLPGFITPSGGGKYTPQQLMQLTKIMGAHTYNGVAGSPYSALSGNSNPAVQQLLNQYIASSNKGAHKGTHNYGSPLHISTPYYRPGSANSYSSSPNANLYGPYSNLISSGINSYGIGPNPYHRNPGYGLDTNSYLPNSNQYGPNSNIYGAGLDSYYPNANPYASNIHPYSPNHNSYAYSLHPHSSNLYTPGPYSNPYSTSGTYRPNSGSSYGFNNLGYDGGGSSYGTAYHGQEEYGAHPNFLSPNPVGNYNPPYQSASSNSYSEEASVPHFTIPALPTYEVNTPSSQPFNYAASKNGYQPPIAPGGYIGGNQGTQKNIVYSQNDYSRPEGTGPQNYGSGGYASSGPSYQTSSNDYSGISQGNNAVYGSTVEHHEAGTYPSYDKTFFPSTGPSGNIGSTYQGNTYGPKSYVRPSVDQPYGNVQNGDKYKYSVASDLAKQIESLEGAIKGLNRGDYYQTPEDKATVANLEQRIYELKGVISSLNEPSYKSQPSYSSKQLAYGSKSPEPLYNQNQGTYKQPQQSYAAPPASYGGISQSGSPTNTYGYSSQTPYRPSGEAQTISHSSYSSYPPSNVSPQLPYSTDSHPQTSYANPSPPQAPNPQPYQETRPSYTSNQPSSPNYSLNQPNQHSNSPTSYQTGPQVAPHSSVAYQPTQPAVSPPYQPKAAFGDDRSISHGVHKELHRTGNTVNEKSRIKRQINGLEAQMSPEMSPVMPPYAGDADMTINMRKNNVPGENGPVGYNLGDDSFTQIANLFKKYLEENLTSDATTNDQKRYQPANNQENRNSAVAGLQEKLDSLKKQLESKQQSERSLSDFFPPPGISNHIPSTPISYGSTNYLTHQYKNPGITSLEKTFSDKKQDIFTQIVLKILEKVLGALPSVLERLFGNLVSTVGNSYGDYYSPLQNVFKNLGAVGYIPLILIRLLDTASVIVQHLGKNKLFKNFLLPAGAVAVAALFILFLVYFYQQDEPYGYISYQGNNKYPQYDSGTYQHQHNNYGATDYNNYGNSRSNSYYSPDHRLYMGPPINYNGDFYGGDTRPVLDNNNNNNLRTYNNPNFDGKSIIENFNNGEGNIPLRYSRGYYDYFGDRFMSDRNKNINR